MMGPASDNPPPSSGDLTDMAAPTSLENFRAFPPIHDPNKFAAEADELTVPDGGLQAWSTALGA
jgi:hypothetical protein